MRPRRLLMKIIALLTLVYSTAVSAGEFELAKYNLSKNPPGPGHVSRDMMVGVAESQGNGPLINIDLWQGECELRVRLCQAQPLSATAEDDTVTILVESLLHRIYCVPSGIEWEIKLSEKPESRILEFDIETDNLVFYRQDSLSDFEKHSLEAHRPDSVIGAWVAYHSTKANNHRIIRGNDTTYYDYGTGQAFIIYRPRAWDEIDTVWCELSIDQPGGRISIHLDSVWLANATYPVTIDPTFGNTDVGASTLAWNQSFAYCHSLSGTNIYTVPQTSVASVTGYSVYGCETGAGDLGVSLVAFDIEGGCPGNRVDQPAGISVSGGTPAWFSSATVAHSLESSSEYGVAVSCAPRAGGTIYYNSVSDAATTDNTNCDLGSTQWTPATVTDFNFSMYATYTEQETTSQQCTRRRRHLRSPAIEGREK